MEKITAWLTGHSVPAPLVGLARGALIGGGIAVCEALLKGFTDLSLGGVWVFIIPFAAGGVRTVEGVLDGLKKKPAPVTGSPP